MKPQSVYFTVDLSQRPPAESKRGVLVRAFEMAARQAIDDAMGEGSIPGVVLIMATLAPRPVLPEEPKPEACCPGATGLPCSTPEAGRLMPDFCTTCGHELTCHGEPTTGADILSEVLPPLDAPGYAPPDSKS